MGVASVTWASVARTAPSRSARPALMSSSATVTRRAATAPAVVSATTPLVCASASLATSVPSASTRPPSDKLQDRSTIVVRVRPHLASRFHGDVYVGDLGGGVPAAPCPFGRHFSATLMLYQYCKTNACSKK